MKSIIDIGEISIRRFLFIISIIGLFCCTSAVVADDIQAAFAPVPISGPAPLNVTFVDQSRGNASVWNWDLDGNPGWDKHEQNPNFTYTSPGVHFVNLTVWNGTGVPNWTSQNITVTNPVLNPLFTASPISGYPPLNVSFIDQSIGARSWNWTFGDNFSTPPVEAASKSPIHTYTTPGWFDVTLNISDNSTFTGGNTADLVHDNFVHVLPIPPPQADFTASPQSGTANLTVVFTDQTPATESLSYLWNFGDHSLNDNRRNPVHEYSREGVYNVSVEVTGTGGSTLIEKMNYIAVGSPPAPVADFAVTPVSGTAPLNVSFIGLGNGTGHLTYEWDFGDASTHEFGRNVMHTYQSAANYPVILTVSDGTKTGSVTRNNCVIVQESTPPIIAFTGSPTSGQRPLNVSFSDFSTGLNATPWYQWWFGDGQISHARLPVNTYNASGVFDVCLTVLSDGVPYTKKLDDFIHVSDSDRTNAMFTAAPRNGTSPLEVSFIDQSVGVKPLSYQWDFGDNSQIDYIQNPKHIYKEPGLYNVSLLVSGSSGSDLVKFPQYVTVQNPALPISGFTATPQSGPFPLNVSFIDQSSGIAPLTYTWNFGDNTQISHDKNPEHQYKTAGNFSVNLTVTNSVGSAKTEKENYIQVSEIKYPFAAFTASPMNGSVSQQVVFIDQSRLNPLISDPAVYTWDFGDNSTSHNQSPVHTYTNPGNYTVIMNLTHGGITSADAISHILVGTSEGSRAMFTASPRNGTTPLEVNFIDQSYSTETLSYDWDFGDGSVIVHNQNPVHRYTSEGLYNVSLAVKGKTVSDLIKQTNFIRVGAPELPSIDFTASPPKGPAPLLVSFVDLSKGSSPLTYAWNFGDNSSISYDRNPSHLYSSPGLYTVNLVVNSTEGSNSVIKEKAINVTDIPYPKAFFAALPQNGSAPLQVQFIDQSELNPGATEVHYSWNFGGEGTSEDDPNPIWTFNKSGDYLVDLAVTTDLGTSTSNVPINVTAHPVPQVDFSASPMSGYAPLTVSFIDLTSPYSSDYSYIWEFGDGSPVSSERNPNHTYSSPGVYSVNLTLNYSGGSVKVGKSELITTVNGPGTDINANFSVNNSRGITPLQVNFFDQTSGSPVRWNWTFGDGNRSQEQSPDHTYLKEGNYSVTLTAFSGNGNSSTLYKENLIQIISKNLTSRFIASFPDYPSKYHVKFYDYSVGSGINVWNWTFGDGVSSSEKNSEHTYGSTGLYTITLKVSNGFANSSSSRQLLIK